MEVIMAKVKRSIIKIDEDKCDGCGLCIPSCKEGALQIVNGKAKLVSEVYCDGLGACLGECPKGALRIIEREADEFDEEEVAKRSHSEQREESQAENGSFDSLPPQNLRLAGRRTNKNESRDSNHDLRDTLHDSRTTALKCGCPGTMAKSWGQISEPSSAKSSAVGTCPRVENQTSELRQWPVQLHLIPVNAPYLKDSNLVLMADCTAVAYPNLHRDFIKGKSLAIACPKLDDISEYVDKLADIIKQNNIKKIEVVMMEVPCCKGLMKIAENAVEMSGKGVILKEIVISLEGKIK
jgi:NAD-dependent dihydropyrimidine dehydrogenase PreA subunit